MIAEILTAVFVVCFNINYTLLLFSVIFPEKIKTGRKSPSFTAIIANADSGSILRKTLSNIRKADYPQQKVEIIVVDNTGRKDVAAAAKRQKARLIKDTVSAGKGAALNMGIKKAKNEVLYFLDSDTFIERNALKNIAQTLSGGTAAVQGVSVAVNKTGLLSSMARLEIVLSNSYNFWCARFLKTSVTLGRNFAIYKSKLAGIGGFSSVLAEDINLARRLYEKNLRVAFNSNVVAEELVPSKLSHLWKQHERWYSGGLREISSIRKADIILLPFIVTISLFHVFLPILGLIFIITGNIFALIGMATGFMVVLREALKYLTKTEVVLLPLLIVALSFFSAAIAVDVLAKRILGIRIGWYKTPKAMTARKY